MDWKGYVLLIILLAISLVGIYLMAPIRSKYCRLAGFVLVWQSVVAWAFLALALNFPFRSAMIGLIVLGAGILCGAIIEGLMVRSQLKSDRNGKQQNLG